MATIFQTSSAITTASTNYALSPAMDLITIRNTGGTDVYFIAQTSGTATASTNHFPIFAGETLVLGLRACSTIALATASGTSGVCILGRSLW